MNIRRLKKIPLRDENGIVRSEKCNLITFYCPICDCIHENYKRDMVYVVQESEDEDPYLVCSNIGIPVFSFLVRSPLINNIKQALYS